MPKIVPDIQNKILSVAELHFKDYGFEKTDMREIAKDTGIAVGTIYLHYQNKENLYINVIAQNWKHTLERIEEISQEDEKPDRLLKKVLLELVQVMTNRKSVDSLWMEIGMMHHLNKDNHFSELHNSIARVISTILQKIGEEQQNKVDIHTFDKLGSLAIIMTVDSCMQGFVDVEKKVDLIIDLLITYLEKSH